MVKFAKKRNKKTLKVGEKTPMALLGKEKKGNNSSSNKQKGRSFGTVIVGITQF